MLSEVPLVSVIIPSINRCEMLAKAVGSALSSSYENVEVVVVDGGSHDGTRELLEGYQNRVRWVSEPDLGEADAYNKGIGMAEGEILCFLPSDDLLAPHGVEAAVHTFAKSDMGVALVNGDAFLIDASDQIIGFLRGRQLSADYLLNKYSGHIIQSSTFLRRRAVEEVGGWDPSIRYANDFDLWIRVLNRFRGRYVQAALSSRRRHPESLTVKEFGRAVRETYKVRRRYGGRVISRATYEEVLAVLKPFVKKMLRIQSINYG